MSTSGKKIVFCYRAKLFQVIPFLNLCSKFYKEFFFRKKFCEITFNTPTSNEIRNNNPLKSKTMAINTLIHSVSTILNMESDTPFKKTPAIKHSSLVTV